MPRRPLNLPPQSHTVYFPGLAAPKVVMARSWSHAMVEAAHLLNPAEKAAFIAARAKLPPCDQGRWQNPLGF